MGKEYKNIDDLFRSELGGSTQKAPTFVKENIDASLGFNKRRFRWLFIGIFVGVIGLTAGLLWLFNDNDFNQFAHKQTELIPERHHNDPDNTDKDLTENDPLTSSGSTNAGLANSGSSGFASTNVGLTNTETSGIGSKNGGLANTESTSSELVNNELTDVESTDNESTGLGSKNAGLTNTALTGSESTRIGEVDSGITEAVSVDYTSQATEINDSTKKSFQEVEQMEELAGVERENNQNEEENTIENDSVDNDQPNTTANTTIDPKPEDYKPWMLNLSSGINKTRTNYTSLDMVEENYYNTSLTDGMGWSINADLTCRFANGLTFGSGIGYTELNSNYDYPLNEMEFDTSSYYDYEYEYELIYDTYLSTTIDSSEFVWTTEYVADSVPYAVDSALVTTIDSSLTNNTYSGRNQIGYMQIPFSIGTQMQFGKFQLDLFAQTRLNLLIRSNGALVQDNTLMNYTKADGIYRPFYMDLMLGTRLHYAIFDRLYINASFQYRPVIGSAYQSATLTKSFDYFHTGIGLSWRF